MPKKPAKKKTGRNKLPDAEKKKQLTIYIEHHKIDAVGGDVQAKLIAFAAITEQAKNNTDDKRTNNN